MNVPEGIVFPKERVYEPGVVRRGHGQNWVPHWQFKDAVYHISFRLIDAIPETVKRRILEERRLLTQWQNELPGLSVQEQQRQEELYSERVEHYLAAGYGECILKQSQAAEIVKQSLEYFDGQKYRLHAWCIMPNHLHVAMDLLSNDITLGSVVSGWKSFTAREINKCFNRNGALWQPDYYNRIIRDYKEYVRTIEYIWLNPDKAKLQNWEWRWMRIEE